jgi:hypothetical protein
VSNTTLTLDLPFLCRKNANHPDLITGQFEQSIMYPPPDELIKECGKMQLLQRMLVKLHAEGHKVRVDDANAKNADCLARAATVHEQRERRVKAGEHGVAVQHWHCGHGRKDTSQSCRRCSSSVR